MSDTKISVDTPAVPDVIVARLEDVKVFTPTMVNPSILKADVVTPDILTKSLSINL
jgi:hypothetical protein